jgi:hypothetical protein
MQAISDGIYNYLETKTQLIDIKEFGWHFIDCKALLTHVPELVLFFKKNKLIPRHAAITIVETNDHLSKHIDEPPVVAKMNLPVRNTQGWANRWYVDNKMVAEILDLDCPIVFNSQIEHSVEKTTADNFPRLVASFTFYNEPIHLLK